MLHQIDGLQIFSPISRLHFHFVDSCIKGFFLVFFKCDIYCGVVSELSSYVFLFHWSAHL